MSNEIIIALISLIGVIVTACLNSFSKNINSRLDRLEKKVDEHNNWGEKFGDYVTNIKVIQKDIEWLKKK